MAQAQIIATVSSLSGEAYARSSVGNMRRLKPGDAIREGETVVTAEGAQVVLRLGDGRDMIVGQREAARFDAEVGAPVKPDAADSAVANDQKSFRKIAQALTSGSDLDALLEDPAAGTAGPNGNEGHTFIELLRVVETVSPLSYQFGTDRGRPLDTIDSGVLLNRGANASAITIGVDAPDNTNDTTPVISGVSDAPAGSAVTVVLTDSSGTSQTLTTTVQPGGNYSVTPPLPLAQGNYTATATVSGPNGNTVSATDGGTVDTTPPIISVVAPDNTTDTTPAITGTTDAPSGSTVTLVVTDAGGNTQTLTATVQPNGSYSVEAGTPLADGTYHVDASVTDPSGNIGTGNDVGSINTTPLTQPSITVASITPDNTINATEAAGTVTISGTTTNTNPGDPVSLVINGVTYSGTVGAGGGFSISGIPGSGLTADSDLTVDATVVTTDLAGNPASGSSTHAYLVDTTPPAQPTITVNSITPDNTLNATEAAGTVTITGSTTNANPGDPVSLVINGVTYSGTVGSGGSFSISGIPGSGLTADSDLTVDASVTTTDLAGNPASGSSTHAYLVDTTPPAQPTITVNSITPDNTLNATEAAGTVTITGSTTNANPGDPVSLVINGVTYSGTVGAGGGFSISGIPGSGLTADSDLTVEASVTTTDLAGNPASGSSTHAYLVDISAPVLTSAATSGLEDPSFVTVTLSAADAISVASFRLSTLPTNGTLYLDAGMTQLALVNTDYSSVGGLKNFYFKPVADWNGSTTFDYSAKDVAGNVSSVATETIGIAAVADIADDSVTTNEDTMVNIDVNANDSFENAGHTITAINGTVIAVGGSVAVGNGSVMLKADGTLDFTPTANVNGATSFTYSVTSGGVSETATVKVMVNAVNDAPTVIGGSVSGTEDTPLILSWANFGASDIDSANSSMSVTITALPASGTLQHYNGSSWTAVTAGSSYTNADINAGNLRFMPALNESGTTGYSAGLGNMKADYAQLTYTVSDGSLSSSTGTMTVDITPVADAPTLSLATGGFMRSTTFDELSAKSGPNPWTRYVADMGDGNWHTSNAGGTVESYWEGEYLQDGNASNRVLELEPNSGAAADLYTDVSTKAGQVYHLSFDFAERLNNQNVGTQGLIPAYGTSQIDVYWGGVKVATLNTDTSNWTHFELDLAATVTGSTRLTFQATDSNSVGGILDNLSLQLSQNTALSNTTMQLPQPAAALVDTDGSETLALSIANIPVGAIVTDGTHSFTATAGNQVATITGWNYAALMVMPPAGFTGSFTLNYTSTATETVGGSVATTISPLTINVIAPNTAPVASNDTVTGVRDVVIHGNVLSNDSDADGNTLYVTGFTVNGTAYPTYDSVGVLNNTTDSVTIAGVGYFRMLADGSYSFTPIAGYTGTAPAISYTIADEHGGYSTATLGLSVSATAGIPSTSGVNTLNGTAGDDIISAWGSIDTLNGQAGNDVLDGGAGTDVLIGGAGDDVLWGRTGNDTLTGGTGSGTDTSSNTFAWAFGDQGTTGAPAVDTITDFNKAPVLAGGDVLDLRDLLIGEFHNPLSPTGNLTNYLHFTVSGGTTTIEVKSHGVATGSADEKIVLAGVDLTNAGALTTDQVIIQDLLTKGKLVVD